MPPQKRRRAYSTGDSEIDERIRALIAEYGARDPDLAFEIIATALRLSRDDVGRLDRKIVNSALKEMRYAFRVFAPYRHERKVTIFGSARSAPTDPEYVAAREFAEEIVSRGWMVVTGAGPGVMEGAQEGAGSERSFGVNIRLPFEAAPNPFIAEDPKLINFKYFFTRKLMFIKEADAFVLCPGGFGTLDETFELLTLIQTGKSDLHPIVLLDPPGGKFWTKFDAWIHDELIATGFVSPEDDHLYMKTDDINEAVAEIERFYRVYHSQRFVNGRLVFRLKTMPDDETLKRLTEEFADIIRQGTIEPVEASPEEIKDDDAVDLPRIALWFDRMRFGRLRMLIDRLNELPVPPEAELPAGNATAR
ncbi:MAG: TIGR00730 family Rossman fold protein [Actinomycetota bacterium]